jgi:hypothetical protein
MQNSLIQDCRCEPIVACKKLVAVVIAESVTFGKVLAESPVVHVFVNKGLKVLVNAGVHVFA